MRNKAMRMSDAVAKLHLEVGDGLILDARMFTTTDLRLTRIPQDVRLFPVIPLEGQTVRDCFLVMHDEELRKLTVEKLKELLDAAS